MFSSAYRRFFVLLLLFAISVGAGAYVRLHRPITFKHGAGISDAWSVETLGPRLAVNWNFDAPIFQNARNATLEIEDGSDRREISLNPGERASTLYLAPREADVTLRLRVQPAGAAEPEKIEVIRLVSQKAQPISETLKRRYAASSVPDEGSRSRLDSPISVWRVRAFAPASLTSHLGDGGMDVAVYVKIGPTGKVSEASTRPYRNATEAALAKIAIDAARQWKFQPMKTPSGNPIYRDFVLHFKFPKT